MRLPLALTWILGVMPAIAAADADPCARLLASKSVADAAAGHECLAQSELRSRAGATEAGAPDEGAAERALAHLDRAEALAPGRRQVHLLRLHLLVEAERLGEIGPALERALARVPAPEPDDWLGVPAWLFARGFADEALAASKLLEKRWPRHPGVLGSKGAALAVLERDEEALIYLRAAAEGAPLDPVHHWNLARLLAYTGRTEEAAIEFATWSSLEKDRDRLMRNSCIFAGFVEKQLGDRPRACMLQQEFCPEPARSACVPLPAPTEHAP